MAQRTPLNPENDLDGYDESQRAEVHEYEGGGPVDGTIRTDMTHDRGGDLDEELDDEAAEIPEDFQETGELDEEDLDDQVEDEQADVADDNVR